MNMVHIREPRPVGRAARRAAKRQEIVEAAWAVVMEGGFSALTLQRLAKRLGYAVGALYRYFPSKEALLAALEVQILTDLVSEMQDALAKADADAPDDPELAALAALRTQIQVYMDLPRRHPEAFRLLSFAVGDPRILVNSEADAKGVLDAARPLFALLAQRLEHAAAAGALEPGEALTRAVVLWSGLHGVLQTHKLGRVSPELMNTAGLTEYFVQSILQGWGATIENLNSARELVFRARNED